MNYNKRYQILCKLRDYCDSRGMKSTELIYKSEFELLIAVLLSSKTKDTQVNKATAFLFKDANTPQSMLLLGIEKIRSHIKCVGLYNSKAQNIIRTCQLLVERYHGLLPNNRLELESLPGVGPKTANVILNLVFGYPTIAVDTHVFRVCNRSGLAVGKNVQLVEKELISIVPEKFKKNCHQWLVVHGRYTCRSKSPKCGVCTIKDLCEFYNNKNQNSTIN